jgi:hypothetical protein
MPSLFDFHANISVNENALKVSTRAFHATLDLPNLKTFLPAEIDPVSLAFIDGILNVELQVPLYNIESMDRCLLPPIPTGALDIINTSIVEWLENSVNVLGTPESMQNGRIPSNFFLQMMRAFAFIETSGSTAVQAWKRSAVYVSFSNLLAGTALYRYCVTVLEPLIDDLPKKITKRTLQMTELLESMSDSIGSWILYCQKILPQKPNVDVSSKF